MKEEEFYKKLSKAKLVVENIKLKKVINKNFISKVKAKSSIKSRLTHNGIVGGNRPLINKIIDEVLK